MTVGGWWVVVPVERRGGPTSGRPMTEPALYVEATAQLQALAKDHDGPLGLAYVRDEDHERRDESGTIKVAPAPGIADGPGNTHDAQGGIA